MTTPFEPRNDEAARLAALARYAILDTPTEAAFDDIANLAASLCNTPVALVSLIDHDRQWFKARVGFGACQTDLDSSVCKFALVEPDLLIIPDLTRDARTTANPLVGGDPAIRFYAGAPLRTGEGVVIGSLCVIDTVPRPDGLNDAQADGLRALGRSVVATLEYRRLLAEGDRALDGSRTRQNELMTSEAHWRRLFERFSEPFVIGEMVRDETGASVDWRLLAANGAWAEMARLDPQALTGTTMRQSLPDVADAWITDFAAAVDSGQAVSFSRGASDGRWLEGRCFSIGNDRFAAIFIDATRRVAAERRQAALLDIGDHLRVLDSAQAMTEVVARIVGQTLAVTRVAFGRIDRGGDVITLYGDWTAPGIATMVGQHRFATYGDLLQEMQRGEPLIIADAASDPRTRAHAAALARWSIAALVNVPVTHQAQLVAALVIHHDEIRSWSDADLTFLRGVADRLEAAVVRAELDDRRKLQSQELSHRLKNTLAMVQAIASQSLKGAEDRPAVDDFQKRLTALATGHDVLLRSDWADAPLHDVIGSTLAAAAQEERVSLAGPPVDLVARGVLSVSLIIHELTTNAVKYGALSVAGGTVAVAWRIQPTNGVDVLELSWTEMGGPSVVPPTRRGFGSRLINMGLGGTGGVDLCYHSTGLVATLLAPLNELTQ